MPIDEDEWEEGITKEAKAQKGIPVDEDIKCHPNLTVLVREKGYVEFYKDGEKVVPEFLEDCDSLKTREKEKKQ